MYSWNLVSSSLRLNVPYNQRLCIQHTNFNFSNAFFWEILHSIVCLHSFLVHNITNINLLRAGDAVTTWSTQSVLYLPLRAFVFSKASKLTSARFYDRPFLHA